MRSFEGTHPWLTFSVDLTRAPARLWVMLGECQSKCEHVAGVPLRPQTAKHLYQVYLAKGSLATTAIEGNTLSEEEVMKLIEGKLKLPRSKEYLAQEVENIIKQCNQILKHMTEEQLAPPTPDKIRELNRGVLDGLELQEGVRPGEFRRYEVGVARYKGAPAEDCPYLLDRLCSWLNGEGFAPAPGMSLVYAILKAIVAHLYLAWIHPFGDGNGRTARLVEFEILIASGVPAPCAHLLSNHYNQTRSKYYLELDKASRSGGDVVPFLLYAVEGLLDGLREQLGVIREQQWDVAWRNYVHESFRQEKRQGPRNKRRRELVLALSQATDPVALVDLLELSPRLATEYAGKSRKTLERDVTAMIEKGLLQKVESGIAARKETILAFLPPRARGPEV